MVIVSHTYTIGGFGLEPLARHVSLGLIAVYGFFALSGALVARSAEGAGTSIYLWHRVRRIFPAYWACLLATAFAIAPLIAVLRGFSLDVLSPGGQSTPYTYVTNNFLLWVRQPSIGNVLHGFQTSQMINGSLWTLAYEFTCYLVIFAIVRCWLAAGRRNIILVLAVTMSIVLAVADSRGHGSGPITLPLIGNLTTRNLFPMLATFLVGSAMALWRDWVPFTPRIVAGCAIAIAISIPLDGFIPYGALLMPYVVLGLGAYLPRRLRPIGTTNDFSYGLYLYGFPAGLMLMAISTTVWTPVTLAITSIALAGAFAVASWFVVERWFVRPAQRAR
jgi:peptidoglycan/LPS O-acetylase OafA/YrhL